MKTVESVIAEHVSDIEAQSMLRCLHSMLKAVTIAGPHASPTMQQGAAAQVMIALTSTLPKNKAWQNVSHRAVPLLAAAAFQLAEVSKTIAINPATENADLMVARVYDSFTNVLMVAYEGAVGDRGYMDMLGAAVAHMRGG